MKYRYTIEEEAINFKQKDGIIQFELDLVLSNESIIEMLEDRNRCFLGMGKETGCCTCAIKADGSIQVYGPLNLLDHTINANDAKAYHDTVKLIEFIKGLEREEIINGIL